MVVYRCAECEANLSRSVVGLADRSLLRTDPYDHVFPGSNGYPDMVPQGFRIASPTEAFPVPGSTDGWPILNPEDTVETEYDWRAETGCCGPPGARLNTDCRNGHKVAAERGDCYTVHAVALDPDRVTAVDDPHPVTPGLDEAETAVWLETLERGSVSDRRRAIALCGAHGVDEAVPVLSAVLKDGPPSLRSTAARSLGRIGSTEAVDSLTSVFPDAEPPVRETVAMAIGGCDIEGTDRILLGRLVDESVEDVCRRILAGVGRITPEQYRDYIDRTAAPCAQSTLVKLLPREGTEPAAVLSRTVVRPERSTTARKQAARRLGYLDRDASPSSDADEVVATALIRALAEVADPEVRVACVWALHNRYHHAETVPTAVERTLERLRDDSDIDEAVRSAARDAL